MPTFAEQVITEVHDGYFGDDIQSPESIHGGLTRVFDKLEAKPSASEVEALQEVLNKPAEFHKLICQQLEPLVKNLFFGDGTLASLNAENKKVLTQGLYNFYVGSLVDKDIDLYFAGSPLMHFIQGPESILDGAHPTSEKPSPFPDDAADIQKDFDKINAAITMLNSEIENIRVYAKPIKVEDTHTEEALRAVTFKLAKFSIGNFFSDKGNVRNFKQKLPSFLHNLKQFRRELEDSITKLEREVKAHQSHGLEAALLPIVHAGQDIIKGIVRLIDDIFDICKSLDVQMQKHIEKTLDLVDDFKPKLDELKKPEDEDETPTDGIDLK